MGKIRGMDKAAIRTNADVLFLLHNTLGAAPAGRSAYGFGSAVSNPFARSQFSRSAGH